MQKCQRYIGKGIILLLKTLIKNYKIGGRMGLQNDVKHYLSRFGISKSHMAKALNITIQQLSAWTNGKLVLSEYHMDNIRKYVDTMKQVDEFLQVNNLVM